MPSMLKWQALISRTPHCVTYLRWIGKSLLLSSTERFNLKKLPERKDFTECIYSLQDSYIGCTLITTLKECYAWCEEEACRKIICFCWNVKTSAICLDFWFWCLGKLSLVEHLIVTYLRWRKPPSSSIYWEIQPKELAKEKEFHRVYNSLRCLSRVNTQHTT